MKIIVVLTMLTIIFILAGCSVLKIEREYSEEAITREIITTKGFLINRANQLILEKRDGTGAEDTLRSAIEEDASPGIEAMRQGNEMLNIIGAAYMTGLSHGGK